jgi:hypothetical protein
MLRLVLLVVYLATWGFQSDSKSLSPSAASVTPPPPVGTSGTVSLDAGAGYEPNGAH